jgi:hypothetical protein
MDDVDTLVLEALQDGKPKTKKDLIKTVPTSGAFLASSLRRLKQQGRIVTGSDGSKRVYRKP